MAKFKFTERNVALLCAIVLVLVSATAAWRQYHPAQPTTQPDTPHTQPSGKKEQEDSTEEQDTSSAQTQPTEDQQATDTNQSSKATGSDTTTDKGTESTPAPSATERAATYTFTAVAGDSYTEFAREAITSYSQQQHLTLSCDALLNAEVTLTNTAGSPELEIGQTITITDTAIAQALQAAGVPKTTKTPTTHTPASQPSATASDSTSTATPGDSYTTLVRATIANYLQANTLSLTTAQRVAAETFVAQAAGAPNLSEGQSVTIPAAAIQQAVERATQLDAGRQAAWQPYADTVAW